MVKLGLVITQVRGVSYSPKDLHDSLNDESIILLRANNIKDGKINFDDVVYIDKKKVNKNQYLCRGDILICTSSGSKELVGKAAFFAENTIATFGAFCKVIRPSIPCKEFIGHFFNSPFYRRKISSLSSGANINNIRNEHIDNLEINLPTENIQEAITRRLNLVNSLIESRQKQLSKFDQLVKSRFIEMFGDPERNPYRWELATVEDVCSSIVRGPFGSALKKEFFVKPDKTAYKVYEQKNAIQKSATIGTYYINREKYYELRRFECFPGDILMSCSGTMGELYQLPPTSEKGIINQALCKFTLNNKILPVFFLAYMKETIGNLEVKGSGIQNIAAVSYVKAMPINLPPISVQKQFATFCTQIDKSKLPVKQSLETLETLKKSLMQEYFG